ncbi:Protein furry-like protein-like protein [Aphelenchoides bicaudatus]|nr:Protein furry-like protein-like protein [Aphelenchoides bicaudatus]
MGFSQVFRECCLKLSTLLRDASHLLTSSNEQMFRMDMSSYFTHALNVVLKLAECPFLFVTASYLLSTNLLQAEKYNLYQMRQHLETFLERREQSIRALNSIKSSLKLQTLSSQSSGLNIVSQEIELCRYFLQESFLYTGLRQL